MCQTLENLLLTIWKGDSLPMPILSVWFWPLDVHIPASFDVSKMECYLATKLKQRAIKPG